MTKKYPSPPPPPPPPPPNLRNPDNFHGAFYLTPSPPPTPPPTPNPSTIRHERVRCNFFVIFFLFSLSLENVTSLSSSAQNL